jgi:DNA-binding MarR family transcriptional regulator
MPSLTKTVHDAGASATAVDLPLPALLSQVLVAFTIEFDNEFEKRMPHRTTNNSSMPASRQGPWLVSLVMWSNCMQFVSENGVRAGKLVELARTKTNFHGMHRWGYIDVDPGSADGRRKPPRRDWLIRATPRGRKAQEVWRPLFAVIEKRWQARFGADVVNQLRKVLAALISEIDIELPECLPILQYGLFSRLPNPKRRALAGHKGSGRSGLALSVLLSRVLLAFAIEFERESDLSLAICANVLRILDDKTVRLRDLPLLAGVSKEAISMAMGVLQKMRVAVIKPEQTGGRTKVVRLTAKGRKAKHAYRRLLRKIEDRWQERFGREAIRTLRKLLEQLVGEASAQRSPLFGGLEPYPDGWRASVRRPNTLPHFPMVLHRGGFPDGS